MRLCPIPVQEACCTQSFTVDLIDMNGELFCLIWSFYPLSHIDEYKVESYTLLNI